MALHNVLGRNVIWWEDKNLEKYWTKYSEYIIEKYPNIDNSNHAQIVDIFKDSFNFFVNKFESEVKAETNVAFFASVFGFHDTSIEIYLEQLNGATIAPFDEGDFSTYRRILKLIMELSLDIDLIAGENLINDMVQNRNAYIEKIESLMYLGLWSYTFAEHVAHMDLMGPIHGLEIGEDGIISVLTHKPFGFLIYLVKADYHNHLSKVVVDNVGVEEFKDIVENSIGVSYNDAGQFLQGQVDNPNQKFALLPYQGLKDFTAQNFGYTEGQVERFYSGLVLNRANKLTTIDSILNPQKNERYIYRPMLLLNTNLGECIMISLSKWSESIMTLTTNAIPWGYSPPEWLQIEEYKQYSHSKKDNHDKLLEDEAQKIFENKGIKFDRNIKSFKPAKGNNISCDVPEAGEMDSIFIDEKAQIIYILECKHNRSRFDMVSFRKEFNNFTNSYEPRLELKVKWLEKHRTLIKEHFVHLYPKSEIDISKFTVKGIFLINAPNFNLYNGNMPYFTLTTLEQLVNGTFIEQKYKITLEREKGNRILMVEKPYFTNTHLELAKSKRKGCLPVKFFK